MPRKPKYSTELETDQPIKIEIDGQKWWQRVVAFVNDPRTRIVSGIVLVTIAVLMSVAYVSYYFTGAADQSVIELPHAERVAQRLNVQNILGLPGALISEGLIDGAFGIMAIVIMMAVGLYGLLLLHATNFGRLRLLFISLFLS